MSYIALYRKWRPRQFEDVVGQEHITTTLRNQILYDRIAHAYLFSGTRGTGKTSTAKIFARAVNCPEHREGNPCGECEVCRQIETSGVMDIIEIDAASNRGVDEIRDLREKVKYPPTLGSYKVYIIDEVHMLTQEAFNALLKTLEEPPKHVIFILATTEPHKLPATILSRCQRFDFKRVTIQDMIKRMEMICREMDISIEEKALELIAKNAEGAMRDALSILDQCLSLVGQEELITYQSIIDTLGLASQGWLYDISQSMLQQNIKDTIKFLHQMIDEGKDIIQIVKQLTEHFRNILMVKTLPEAEAILELPQEQMKVLSKQGQEVEEEKLFRFINHLSEVENKMKYASQPTIILEMECIKLCKQPKGDVLETLIERLQILEKRIEEGDFTNKAKDKIPKEAATSKKKPTPSKEQSVTQKPIAPAGDSSSERAPDQKKELGKDASLGLEKVEEKWQGILKEVKKRKVQVAALLKEGQLAQIKEGKLYISFGEGFGFHQTALSKKENIELLEQVISEEIGSLVRVACVMKDQLSLPQDEEEIDPVSAAIELFGEDMVEVVEE